jgi:HEPN domain-containing protein
LILDKASQAWLEYGDHDLHTASFMTGSPKPPLEVIAYHLQQAAEKYLKAGLSAHQIAIPKTHDLLRLNRLLAPAFLEITSLESECDRLSDYGTITRYPNESVTIDEAKVELAKSASHRICDLVRSHLISGNSQSQ